MIDKFQTPDLTITRGLTLMCISIAMIERRYSHSMPRLCKKCSQANAMSLVEKNIRSLVRPNDVGKTKQSFATAGLYVGYAVSSSSAQAAATSSQAVSISGMSETCL
jgi:hypothetical protein